MRKSAKRLAAELGGGQRWASADARRVVSAWESSGESGTAFARRLGVDPQRLYWWKRRLREGASGEVGRRISGFVPVTVRGAVIGDDVAAVVVEATGVRVEVRSVQAVAPGWVADLVRSLREGGA